MHAHLQCFTEINWPSCDRHARPLDATLETSNNLIVSPSMLEMYKDISNDKVLTFHPYKQLKSTQYNGWKGPFSV